MKKILKYEQFREMGSVNEEALPTLSEIGAWAKKIPAKFINKIKSWVSSKMRKLDDKVDSMVKDFYKRLDSGVIRVNKQGKPVIMYYSQKCGSVHSQMMGWETNASKNENFEHIFEEARVPLEYSEPDASVVNVNRDKLIERILVKFWIKTGRTRQDLIDTEMPKSAKSGTPLARTFSTIPLFIFGAVGIGKTEIVAHVCDLLKCDLIFLDIPNMTNEDLLGVPSKVDVRQPVYDKEGNLIDPGAGMTRFNPSMNLPTDPKKYGIIFLDELNKADENMIKTLNQFIQSGRLPGYQLPKNWMFVCAGNRPSDKVNIIIPDSSFVNRFDVVNYVPELGIDKMSGEITGGWAKYVSDTKDERGRQLVMPEILHFLATNEELFHYLESEEETLVFPTPRKWTELSTELYGYIDYCNEVLGKKVDSLFELDPDDFAETVQIKVGPMAGGRFLSFIKLLAKLSTEDMQDIIDWEEPAGSDKSDDITKDSDYQPGKYIADFKVNKKYLLVIAHYLLMKVSPDMADIELRDKQLYNIIKYLSRYQEFEIMPWLLARIRKGYSDWKGTFGAIDSPGRKWRIKGMELLQGLSSTADQKLKTGSKTKK